MIARRHPEEILENTEKTSNFLIIPIGEFDDTESGAAVLAKPDLIKICFKKSLIAQTAEKLKNAGPQLPIAVLESEVTLNTNNLTLVDSLSIAFRKQNLPCEKPDNKDTLLSKIKSRFVKGNP